MDKVFIKRSVKKSKVFNFALRGDWGEFTECMKILKVLDLDKHGIQFLCIRDEGTSDIDGKMHITGLIEMKEGKTVDGVIRFFRNLDIRLWDCISMVAVCNDVNLWLKHKKKIRFAGAVLEKGTLTVPPYSPLFNGS